MMLARARTAQPNRSATPVGHSSARLMGRAPKRRIVMHGPSMASGGTTTLTRDPSGRRASATGEVRSARSPRGPTMRSIRSSTSRRCEVHRGALEAAGPLDPDRPGSVDHDLGDRAVGQDRFEGTETDSPCGDRAGHRGDLDVGQQRALAADLRGHGDAVGGGRGVAPEQPGVDGVDELVVLLTQHGRAPGRACEAGGWPAGRRRRRGRPWGRPRPQRRPAPRCSPRRRAGSAIVRAP